jgi:hypothetical protein
MKNTDNITDKLEAVAVNLDKLEAYNNLILDYLEKAEENVESEKEETIRLYDLERTLKDQLYLSFTIKEKIKASSDTLASAIEQLTEEE